MSVPPIDQEKLLLQQISRGNQLAFKTLIDQYSSIVYNYILKITDDPIVSEEIVQDVFLQLWLTRETLIDINNFGGYLFVVSRNNALNAIKKILRAKAKHIKWENYVIRMPENDPIEYYNNLLEKAINRLSPQQQKAWILNRQLRMSYEETAKEMNISKETVKKHLQVASGSILNFLKSQDKPLCLVFVFGFVV